MNQSINQPTNQSINQYIYVYMYVCMYIENKIYIYGIFICYIIPWFIYIYVYMNVCDDKPWNLGIP
jgi:hypothetical protein